MAHKVIPACWNRGLAAAAGEMTPAPDRVTQSLRTQRIETPSSLYANSGTQFKISRKRACRWSQTRKTTDAAVVHRLTGVALCRSIGPGRATVGLRSSGSPRRQACLNACYRTRSGERV